MPDPTQRSDFRLRLLDATPGAHEEGLLGSPECPGGGYWVGALNSDWQLSRRSLLQLGQLHFDRLFRFPNNVLGVNMGFKQEVEPEQESKPVFQRQSLHFLED